MGHWYWWSRYGEFSPGENILPHMGNVIAHYRKKRYRTQTDCAIAAGVALRTVQEWETTIMTHDQERRIFIANLLKIPPALLGLDWRLVSYQNHEGTQSSISDHWAHLLEEDSFYQYEDILIMAWEMLYSGKLLAIADRLERRLNKLVQVVKDVPEQDKEGWLCLLGQYYQLVSMVYDYRGMDEAHQRQALAANTAARQIGKEIEDAELLVLSLYHLTSLHLQQGKVDLARQCAQESMTYAKQVSIPLRGSMQLREAEVSIRFAAADETLTKQIRNSQDQVLHAVYKNKMESGRSFVKHNRASVHHERAKTLLQLHAFHPERKQLLQDAHHEMRLAWDALTPDIAEWRMFFLLTEARIYQAEHDLEGSVKLTLDALQAARASQSQREEAQVRALYLDLSTMDRQNPYVHHLGVQLGIF